ncbi:MAG: ABC transporter ATP-binding protein/permease [Bacilli bacterium]|nr:ABC transporter ATP-binding protein/permease [Bacilli bacterium]
MPKPIIHLENISKYYTGTGGVGLGLRKVNCSFNLGEFVIITGPSGSGKTTLLNVISGMDTYEEGILYINGEDSTYFGPKEYEEYRGNYISFIFQNYNLIDSFTVVQNVELGLIARGLTKAERREKVLQIIEEVGLSHRKKHRVTQLSGGEKQRVAIARALASDAPIMVCDEITGNLDKKTSEEIIALLRKVSYNKLVLLVSHDVEEAIMHATRVITMHDGMIENDVELAQIPQTDIALTIPESKPISSKTVIDLGIKFLFSTPKKLLLLLFIFIVVNILSTFSYSLYAFSGENLNVDYSGSINDFVYYPGRVVVKKVDNSPITNEEINALKNLKGVKNVIKYDLALEAYARYYFKNIEYSNLNASVRSASDLNPKDLRHGRLPQNENEVVVSINYQPFDLELENYVGQELRLRFDFEENANDVTIVGVLEGLSEVYVVDQVLERLHRLAIMSYSILELNIPGAPMIDRNAVLVPDPTLTGKEALLRMFVGEEREFDSVTTDVLFSNTYINGTLEDLEITVKLENYPEKEFDNWDWRRDVEYGYFVKSTLRISEEEFANIGLNDYFQVSITPENPNKDKEIAQKIEEGPYYAFALSAFQFDYGNVFSIVTEIFMVILVAILLMGIYFLSYISIRNIIYSEKQGFLVMRSLGIDGKKIRIQIFAQLLILALISFLMLFITWVIIRLRQRYFFLEIIAKLELIHILTVGLIVFVLAAFLALRYSKRLIMSTIVAKEFV